MDESQKPIDDAELRKKVRKAIIDMGTPIDFDDLEAKGILKKSGTWYEVPDTEHLPDFAKKQIKEIAQTKTGAKVKFYKVTKTMKRKAEELKGNA